MIVGVSSGAARSCPLRSIAQRGMLADMCRSHRVALVEPWFGFGLFVVLSGAATGIGCSSSGAAHPIDAAAPTGSPSGGGGTSAGGGSSGAGGTAGKSGAGGGAGSGGGMTGGSSAGGAGVPGTDDSGVAGAGGKDAGGMSASGGSAGAGIGGGTGAVPGSGGAGGGITDVGGATRAGGSTAAGGSNVGGTGGMRDAGGDFDAAGGTGGTRDTKDAPSGETGNDDFLYCPVGCVIDSCQKACTRNPSHDTALGAGTVEYRGKVQLSRTPGDSTAILCGTADEQQNCGTCWGVVMMDQQFPRIWFSVENATLAGSLVHRVHVRVSWNALDATGNPITNVNIFTLIISAFEVRVLDPQTGNAIRVTDFPIAQLGVNPDQTVRGCNVATPTDQRYREFDLDVPVPATSSQSDVVELTMVGNYE